MDYHDLLDNIQSVMDEYFERCREAEAHQHEEVEAAVILQSAWRGKLQREQLRQLEDTVRTIQRFWRGYKGRQRFAAARDKKDRELRLAYFNQAATEIQRWWRGYWSRKHIHSFSARKAYLAAIMHQNAEVRRQMALEYDQVVSLQRGSCRETAREQFERQIGQLHHLVSTQAVQGIFSPPFEVAAGLVPLVEGLTIEEHLQRACKAQVAPEVQRLLKKAGELRPPERHAAAQAARAASGQQQQPASISGKQAGGAARSQKGGGGRLTTAALAGGSGSAVPAASTLRQMAPYNRVKEAGALERRIDRAQIAVLHRQPFLSPSAVISAPLIESATVRSADAFQDPVVGGIVGTRSIAKAQPVYGATGRLFDAYGQRKGFFDPSLKQGY